MEKLWGKKAVVQLTASVSMAFFFSISTALIYQGHTLERKFENSGGSFGEGHSVAVFKYKMSTLAGRQITLLMYQFQNNNENHSLV